MCTGNGGSGTGELCCSDLIADLLDSNRAHFVQNTDDVAVHSHHLRADRHLHIWIGLMHLKQARHHLVLWHELIVEVVGRSGSDADRDEILWLIYLKSLIGRKGNFNALHVSLAQAHHHETREQKEHDVNQRNDLDAGALFRDG